jgi:hypothetical protein
MPVFPDLSRLRPASAIETLPEPALTALRGWSKYCTEASDQRTIGLLCQLHGRHADQADWPDDVEAQEWTMRVELLAIRAALLPGSKPLLLVCDGAMDSGFAERIAHRIGNANSEESKPEDRDVVVMLRGGEGDPVVAYTAIRYLRRTFRTVHVVVTGELGGAGTMFALGASHVHAGPLSLFRPIDAPLRVPSEEIRDGFTDADVSVGSALSAFHEVVRRAGEANLKPEVEFLLAFLNDSGLTAESIGVLVQRGQRLNRLARRLVFGDAAPQSAEKAALFEHLTTPYAVSGCDLDGDDLVALFGKGRATLGGALVRAAEVVLGLVRGEPHRRGWRMLWCTAPEAQDTGATADVAPLVAALTGFTGVETEYPPMDSARTHPFLDRKRKDRCWSSLPLRSDTMYEDDIPF